MGRELITSVPIYYRFKQAFNSPIFINYWVAN